MNVRNIPEPVEAEQPAYDLDVQDLDVLSGRGRESFNHGTKKSFCNLCQVSS
jgi:hypothetical protein